MITYDSVPMILFFFDQDFLKLHPREGREIMKAIRQASEKDQKICSALCDS